VPDSALVLGGASTCRKSAALADDSLLMGRIFTSPLQKISPTPKTAASLGHRTTPQFGVRSSTKCSHWLQRSINKTEWKEASRENQRFYIPCSGIVVVL